MPTGKPTSAVKETASQPVLAPRIIDIEMTNGESVTFWFTGTKGQLVAALKSGVLTVQAVNCNDWTDWKVGETVHIPTTSITMVVEP